MWVATIKDCKLQLLLTLNKLIFATEITVSLFVSGQHLDSPYGDPEKTLHNSKAGEQTGFVSTWSTLLLIAFLANPGVWRLLHFLDLNPCPLSIWRSPDLICDLLTDFIFLIKALFNMRILLWQFSLILRSDHFKWSCFKWNYAHLAFSLFLQKGGLQSGSSETKVFP